MPAFRSAALADALDQACRSLELSSVHVTFCTEDGMAARWARPAGCSGSACSSIGRTTAMRSFDDFLGALSSRKRKVLRRERRDANAAGLTFHALTRRRHHRAALGRVLPVLSLDSGPQMGLRLSDAATSSRCSASGWATGWC